MRRNKNVPGGEGSGGPMRIPFLPPFEKKQFRKQKKIKNSSSSPLKSDPQ